MKNLLKNRLSAPSLYLGVVLFAMTSCDDHPILPKNDNPDSPADEVASIGNGLVGYYAFDGNVADASGSANHAIDYTDSVYVAGAKGEALFFDGTNDYLKLENTIDVSHPLSFSFWVSSKGVANDSENNGAVISKHSWHDKSFYVTTFGYKEARTENRIHASLFGGNGSDNDARDWATTNLSNEELKEKGWDETQWNIVAPTTIELDEWTHVVVNVDDSTLSIFVNGKLTVSKQREYPTYYNSSEATYIGNIFNGGEGSNNHFHGYLDELRIYDRSLTSEEIDALYNNNI